MTYCIRTITCTYSTCGHTLSEIIPRRHSRHDRRVVSSMCAVRSRCASLLGIELVILGTLWDSIVTRRVWRGHMSRRMGHCGREKEDGRRAEGGSASRDSFHGATDGAVPV